MTPRVFVSSTYYDLKHVRERIEKFITFYGFEPILFESDKVTYEHGKPLDQSAYYEVGLCHVMILIIGGRYGSPSSISIQNQREERKIYDEQYVSITRNELETAIQKNIPILIFIDKNAHAEYKTYKENQDFFESLDVPTKKNSAIDKPFKFAHVDDINIFRFIESVSNNAIKTFEKVEEIENYLKLQFAGMFYLYLESLKKKSDDKKILDTVHELNSITLRMNEMLNSVGKKILGNTDTEYLAVIEKQFDIVLGFFLEKLQSLFDLEKGDFSQKELDQIDFKKAAEIIFSIIIKNQSDSKDLFGQKGIEIEQTLVKEVNESLTTIHPELKIKKLKLWEINFNYNYKVKPLLRDITDEDKLIDVIAEALKINAGGLPF